MKKTHKNKFNPLVSIVIPVYNGSNYLKEAIESALSQTYEKIEILVINDGSNDGGETEKIAKSYGNRIRYFSKPNGGTSTALNVGIKNMKGQYFSWLSHDDKYYPNKIKRQIEELNKIENKDTIMMTDLDGIDENYQKIYETHYQNHINYYPLREKSNIHPIIYNQTHGCTLLFSKKCFDVVGLFDEKSYVAQDFEFFYRAFLKFPHKLIPEILVTARDSSNRQGKRLKPKGNVEYSELFIKIIENLSDQEYTFLAPSKFEFYNDMKEFFSCAGYTYALEYIEDKINKTIKVLNVVSNDLIGSKFNGYSSMENLDKYDVFSQQIVLNKQSKSNRVYKYDFLSKTSSKTFMKTNVFINSDIISFHTIHNLIDVNYFPIISKIKPCILNLHDCYFLGGHCVHHYYCEKWKTHCEDCEHLNAMFKIEDDESAIRYEMLKTAIQASNINVIVASKWMMKKVEKSPIFSKSKVYFLPFGINQKIFKPENKLEARKKLTIPKTNLTIMFRSEEDDYKGFDIIKNLLNELIKQHKSDGVTLISVGTKDLLNQFKSKFFIKDYGWVEDDEKLATMYQASDIFLMPSRYESFGMMAAEAMCCGVVPLVLDTSTSALSDTVGSPNYGCAVPENEYVSTFTSLIKNKEKLKNMSDNCLKYAIKKFNFENYNKELVKIYHEVLLSHKIDEDSKITLNQLKKYQITLSSEEIYENGSIVEEKRTIKGSLRRLFRKIVPYKLRFLLIHPLKSLREFIRKTVSLKFRNKIKNQVKKLNKTIFKNIKFEE